MIQSFLLFLTQVAVAQLPLEGQWQFEVLMSGENQVGTYLVCHPEREVRVLTSGEGTLSIEGLTAEPIAFSEIDQGAITQPGYLIGASQRRVTSFNSPESFGLVSEHRDCGNSLLGSLGCLGKDWRQTARLEFQLGSDGAIEQMIFTYQPFAQVPQESCTLKPIWLN